MNNTKGVREKLLIEYQGWVTIVIAPQHMQETMDLCKKLSTEELIIHLKKLSSIVALVERMHPYEYPVGVIALN